MTNRINTPVASTTPQITAVLVETPTHLTLYVQASADLTAEQLGDIILDLLDEA